MDALQRDGRCLVPFRRRPQPDGAAVEQGHVGSIYEWSLAHWGLDPAGVTERLTDEQLMYLWESGVERQRMEQEAKWVMGYTTTRDALIAIEEMKAGKKAQM